MDRGLAPEPSLLAESLVHDPDELCPRAQSGNRTHDLRITSALLCRLSYLGETALEL
jgi:hypothetical protein